MMFRASQLEEGDDVDFSKIESGRESSFGAKKRDPAPLKVYLI